MLERLHLRTAGLLLAIAAVVGCADLPTETSSANDAGPAAATPAVAPAPSKSLKKGGGGPDRVGRIHGTWVEPSADLIDAVEGGDLDMIDMKDSDFAQFVAGLDLVVNGCTDLGSLQLRVVRVEDGAVTASVASEPGGLLTSGPEIIAGDGGSVTGPGGGQGGSCDPSTLLRYTDWGVSGLSVTNPDNMFPAGHPHPDNWVPVERPLQDDWTRGGGAEPGSGPTFLKAKKAFVPAIVVYDEAREWFPGDDVPFITGGFKNEALVGFGSFAGPVVVVGVMPGDNVSVMPGDNVSVMPGDNVSSGRGPGVVVIQFGPGD